MNQARIERQDGYTIYSTKLGNRQMVFTASITDLNADSIALCESIYEHIGRQIHQTKMHMVLERIFGKLDDENQIQTARKTGLEKTGESPSDPFTFIQGSPIISTGLAGIQVRAVDATNPDKIWPISYEGEIRGQGWRRNGTTYLLLQNIHGTAANQDNSRKAQTIRMFDRVLEILKSQGADYRHVVRTWIYLSDILDWYPLFNKVRNEKYQEFGLIQNQAVPSKAESIYLPASTGIQGDNHMGAAGTMDILAVVPGNDSCSEVIAISGKKQKSAFRYGSAFSRAMVIREPDVTQILISGTASISEEGKTLYKGDSRAQILKTLDVVDALVSSEGATLQDIAKATVFLKHQKDYETYLKAMDEYGLSDFPAVVVQADICRSDLLFELDAVTVLDRD